MAEVTKGTSPLPSLCSTTEIPPFRLCGLVAGEAITAGDALYLKAADGKLWKATGAAANAAALVVGFAAQSADAGEAVTALSGCTMYYGTGLTISARYYLSGSTAGGLADAASTGGTVPLAYAKDATRIVIFPINR